MTPALIAVDLSNTHDPDREDVKTQTAVQQRIQRRPDKMDPPAALGEQQGAGRPDHRHAQPCRGTAPGQIVDQHGQPQVNSEGQRGAFPYVQTTQPRRNDDVGRSRAPANPYGGGHRGGAWPGFAFGEHFGGHRIGDKYFGEE